jgi:hypothetical protein
MNPIRGCAKWANRVLKNLKLVIPRAGFARGTCSFLRIQLAKTSSDLTRIAAESLSIKTLKSPHESTIGGELSDLSETL